MLCMKEVTAVKENIHPQYKETTITCACGNVINTGSTKEDIRVEICSNCHPFFLIFSENDTKIFMYQSESNCLFLFLYAV